METEETTKEEITDDDGVRVVTITIIRKFIPMEMLTKVKVKKETIVGPTATKPLASTLVSGKTVTTKADSEEKFGMFERDVLKEHNELRARHGAPALKLSKELCDVAQQWCSHISATDEMVHRPNSPFGENIYWKKNANMRIHGSEPVQSWYAEIKYYTYFGKEPDRETLHAWGHFSQLIWMDCDQVGVGKTITNKAIYVVCNYNPHGNVWTKYIANVLPELPEDKRPKTKTPASPKAGGGNGQAAAKASASPKPPPGGANGPAAAASPKGAKGKAPASPAPSGKATGANKEQTKSAKPRAMDVSLKNKEQSVKPDKGAKSTNQDKSTKPKEKQTKQQQAAGNNTTKSPKPGAAMNTAMKSKFGEQSAKPGDKGAKSKEPK